MSNRLFFQFFAALGSLGIYILAFFIGVFIVFFWFDSNMLSALDENAQQEKLFEIQEGWNLKRISEELEKQGFVKQSWSVFYLSKLRGAEDEGTASIIAGEYSLSPAQTPSEILDTLLQGKTVQHQLVIPPGITVREAVNLIVEANLVPQSQAFEAFRDSPLMQRLGIPAYVPEGYLLAGTFSFSKPISGTQIVTEIITASRERLEQELEHWKKRASDLGFRPYEILTLASILEKEASSNDRPKLSSVYHNRLRIGMELMSEAALRYGLPPDQEEITAADVQAPGPYNTFNNLGLPPTPICSPSIDAVRAALYPAETDFLYFVRTPDGGFDYSETGREHRKKLKDYNIDSAQAAREKSAMGPDSLSQLQ